MLSDLWTVVVICVSYVAFTKAAESRNYAETLSISTYYLHVLSQMNLVEETTTVTVRNNFPDWIGLSKSLEHPKIRQIIDDNVPSKDGLLLSKTILAKLSSLDRQISTSLTTIQRTLLQFKVRIKFEVRLVIQMSLTLMDMQIVLRKAYSLISRVPSDVNLASLPDVMSELLGYFMKAALMPVIFSRLFPEDAVVMDQIDLMIDLIPMLRDLCHRDRSTTFSQFWDVYLANGVASLTHALSNLYKKNGSIYLANLFMERNMSILLKVLLDLLYLRPFITLDIWTDMVNRHYPSDTLGESLGLLFLQASLEVSDSMYFVFKDEKMLVSFLRKTFENMHASIFNNDQEASPFVRKTAVNSLQFLRKYKNFDALFRDSRIVQIIQRIVDQTQKQVLMKTSHRAKKVKTRFPMVDLKKPVDKKTKKTSRPKKSQPNASSAAIYDASIYSSEIEALVIRSSPEDKLCSELKKFDLNDTVGDGSITKDVDETDESIENELNSSDINVEKVKLHSEEYINKVGKAKPPSGIKKKAPRNVEIIKPINLQKNDFQQSQADFWSSAPYSIRQYSRPSVSEVVDPFASLSLQDCNVSVHFLLVGEYCRHEILGRYVKAMGMFSFTWEQVRDSLNSGPSTRVLDELKITDSSVIANCIDILIYRHAIAHPNTDIKSEQDAQHVVGLIRKANEYGLINKLALQALYNAIQNAQTDSEGPKLAIINWKAKTTRQSVSRREQSEVILLLGELANRLVLIPFKDYIIDELGDEAFRVSDEAVDDILSEIKLKRLESLSKDPNHAKVLADLNVPDHSEFSRIVSIVRMRNELAHPKYWIHGSLKNSIREISSAFPKSQQYAVAGLKKFIERLPIKSN